MAWVLRLAKGLAPLHALGEPHGRLSANAVHCVAPEAGAKAQLLAAEDVARDFNYFCAARAHRRVGPSPADDVWALGVLLYRGLTCAYPFPGEGRKGVAERIEWRPASPIEVYGVEHDELQGLLDRLFDSDPVRRLTVMPELIKALVAIEPEADALPGLELDRPTAANDAASALDEPEIDAVVVAEAPAAARPPAAKPAAPAAPPPAAAPEGGAEPTRAGDPQGGAAAAPAPVAARPTGAAPTPRSPLLKPAVIVPFLALVLVAGYAVLRPRLGGTKPAPPAAPPPAAAPSPAGATIQSATATPSSERSAAPATTAAVSSAPSGPAPAASGSAPAGPASATVAPARPATTLECLGQLFPPATFAAGRPNLHFLCTESDPRKGADALGVEIVLGKGRRDTTEAMLEWDRLGWYQLAMFAVARAACCETAEPLDSSLANEACQFDGALMALAEAVVHGGEDDCTLAMARYLEAITCLVNAKYAHAFGEKGLPAPRERPAFEKASQRIRAAVSR